MIYIKLFFFPRACPLRLARSDEEKNTRRSMRYARLVIREKRAKHEQDAIKKKSSVNKNSLVLSTLDFGLCFLSLVVKKKRLTIKYYFFLFSCFFRLKDHPRSKNWTLDFEPAFSQRV